MNPYFNQPIIILGGFLIDINVYNEMKEHIKNNNLVNEVVNFILKEQVFSLKKYHLLLIHKSTSQKKALYH